MDNYWTLDDVMDFLQRTRPVIIKAIREHGLPVTRIGEKGKYYFDEIEVREWFKGQKVKIPVK